MTLYEKIQNSNFNTLIVYLSHVNISIRSRVVVMLNLFQMLLEFRKFNRNFPNLQTYKRHRPTFDIFAFSIYKKK